MKHTHNPPPPFPPPPANLRSPSPPPVVAFGDFSGEPQKCSPSPDLYDPLYHSPPRAATTSKTITSADTSPPLLSPTVGHNSPPFRPLPPPPSRYHPHLHLRTIITITSSQPPRWGVLVLTNACKGALWLNRNTTRVSVLVVSHE
nr:hypothetical protein [Tanacetum cinerariifolium]